MCSLHVKISHQNNVQQSQFECTFFEFEARECRSIIVKASFIIVAGDLGNYRIFSRCNVKASTYLTTCSCVNALQLPTLDIWNTAYICIMTMNVDSVDAKHLNLFSFVLIILPRNDASFRVTQILSCNNLNATTIVCVIKHHAHYKISFTI